MDPIFENGHGRSRGQVWLLVCRANDAWIERGEFFFGLSQLELFQGPRIVAHVEYTGRIRDTEMATGISILVQD